MGAKRADVIAREVGKGLECAGYERVDDDDATGRQYTLDFVQHSYNTERPHSSLGNLTPEEFAQTMGENEVSLTVDSSFSSD